MTVPAARRSAPPLLRPDGFEPDYAAFEPRFEGVDNLTLMILGIENGPRDAASLGVRLLRALHADDGPDVLEHGRVREGYGPVSEIWFAYWRDEDSYRSWVAHSGIDEVFDDPRLLEGDAGLWREVCVMSLDHNETSYSRSDDLTGIAAIADAFAVTEIHGYWGSARDRIAAAATDPLDGEASGPAASSQAPTSRGSRVRVTAPHNACLIRTSQDVNRANEEQLSWYLGDVEPTLLAGLDYLRANAADSGCLDIRFVDEVDDRQKPVGRTCGVGFFDSLASLERWTHHHHTHERIMASFIGMVQKFQGEPGLHLWHEITVFPRGSLIGDYVNCSPDGGLLRLAT